MKNNEDEQLFQGIFGNISDKATMPDKDLKRIHSLTIHAFVTLTESTLEIEREINVRQSTI